MDRLIYLSMTGAKSLMERQDALTHNLANAGTDGFRADLMTARSVPLRQEGTATTRVYSLETTTGYDAAQGPLKRTGNAMDVAIRGQGWLAVQAQDGSEAYNRAGSLAVDATGVLRTHAGLMVMGEGGPITVPEGAEVMFGSDGTVSARITGQPPTPVGRLKLVNPPANDMTKGADGLFRMKSGDTATADETVQIVEGALEGSNVNVVEAMVGMIAVARQFEINMKLLQNAEGNEQRAAQLLSLKG